MANKEDKRSIGTQTPHPIAFRWSPGIEESNKRAKIVNATINTFHDETAPENVFPNVATSPNGKHKLSQLDEKKKSEFNTTEQKKIPSEYH